MLLPILRLDRCLEYVKDAVFGFILNRVVFARRTANGLEGQIWRRHLARLGSSFSLNGCASLRPITSGRRPR
jgi:hypothetical protein